MPSQIFKIKPVGNINRRALVTDVKSTDVLVRENLMVIGDVADERKIKKIAGSKRYNTTAVGTSPVVSLFRYYSKANLRKNFFFSGGVLYHGDDLGNTTALISTFSTIAYPTFVEMRVSSADILFFIEGVNTGMFSYDGNAGNAFNKETAVTLNFVGATSHLDRMFGFEEDSEDLYFSKNLVPTNFTDSTDAGVITIGAKRGSKIQQIALLNETLYIFKTDSMWVLEGRSPSEFQVREIHPSMGLAARRSLQNVESRFIGLMSDYEVWSFNGLSREMKCLTYKMALGGDLTKDLLPLINRDRMDQVNSTYHNFIYRMCFTSNDTEDFQDDNAIHNNMEYCFNTINETDFLTRGNNVAAYLKYDRPPDKSELLTGRADTGRVMIQYQSLNWDNEAASPTMPIRLQTPFFGIGEEPRNIRVRRYWINSGVLGAAPIPIRMYMDGRNAVSDSTRDELDTFGEKKGNITLMQVASQDAITSRQIPRHANSKGLNFSFEINENINNRDFEFSSFQAEIITKNLKRSRFVGV